MDLPGEAGTIMHKMEDMKAVELATVSFGQSFQITPIQLATTVSSIINGGNRITPHFAVMTGDSEQAEFIRFSYPVKEHIVSEETSATMRMILEQVVAEGSGKNGKVEGQRVGGKTATSQTLPRGTGRYIASFVGFAPADDPVLAFQPVGFIISTIVYLFLQILVLVPKEKRSWPLTIIISVVAPLAIYGLFTYLISSPLPKGLWGY